MNIDNLDWKKMNNLIPAIVQDNKTLQVLMLGYMNREALEITLDTLCVTFYSRQKNRLWTKGETSGNRLTLISISMDCDYDTLLIKVEAEGPTCHNNTISCFNDQTSSDWHFLCELENIIEQRKVTVPDNSYTAELFKGGTERIAQKVGEEGIEVALAAVSKNPDKLCEESADLLFHLLVLLHANKVCFANVLQKLYQRR